MKSPARSTSRLSKPLLMALSCLLSFSSFQAVSEDIDIFAAAQDVTPNKPNVLIVLDNSANWSRAAQQWPTSATGSTSQGQSEARALKAALLQLPLNSVNVGLFEYRTEGAAGDQDGGYVASHIRPMSLTNRDAFVAKLDRIAANINAPIEKRSIGNPFGTLMHDVYNYLAGVHAFGRTADSGSADDNASRGAGTPDSPYADLAGYTEPPVFFRKFRSPLTSVDTCTRTIIIFIGNNRQGQLTDDSPQNAAALAALGGSTAQLPFADFDVRTTPTQTNLGETACFASAPNFSTLPACVDGGFTSCDSTGSTPCTGDTSTPVWGERRNGVSPSGAPSSVTTNNIATGEAGLSCTKSQDVPAYSCPATVTQDSPPDGFGQFTRTETSWSGCSYVALPDDPSTTADNCTGTRANYEARGNRTVTTTNFTASYDPASAVGASSQCGASCSAADFPAACTNGDYRNCFCNAGAATPCAGARYTLRGHSNIIEAVETGQFRTAPPAVMADEWARFLRNTGVQLPGTGTDPSNPPVKMRVSTYTIDVFKAQQSADFSALLFSMARAGGGKYFQAKDEGQITAALLAIFQEAQAVNTAFSSASLPVNATNRAQNENQVFIGVFKPDQGQEPRWFGNLKRYQLVSNGVTINVAGEDGQEAINNQTGFIGDCARSFWTTDTGNFWERVIPTDPPYALGSCNTNTTNDYSDLPDGPFVEKGAAAEVLRKGNNPSATPDGDGNYVLNRSMRTVTAATAAGSDLPALNAAAVPDVDRDGDGDVDSDDSDIESLIIKYTRGEDTNDDDGDNVGATPPARALTEPRATIHGDVIHSRPQPINYGGTAAEIASGAKSGVVVFYGANDGAYRAVRAYDGTELWSFVAPEHFSNLGRLKTNSPTIKFFGDPDTIGSPPVPTGELPKDYFFDGSTGVFQNQGNTKVWIFTTMRRGGRKVYAFDVSDDPADSSDGPQNPKFLWSKGCDASGCDAGLEEMSQTWSFPNVGFIKGYSDIDAADARPVVVIGGGYNAPCEDNISGVFTTCANGGGSGVYVLDAEDGTLLRHFDFSGHGIAADVALIDTDNDRNVDYAYAADLGGNIYRMDFVGCGSPPCDENEWTSTRVAYTNGSNRKFIFSPALFQASSNIVYVAIGSGDREAPLMAQYPCGGDADSDGICDGGVANRFYVFKDLLDQTTAINLDDIASGLMEDYTSESETSGCPDSDTAAAPELPVCLNERGLFPNEVPQSPNANAQRGWFINLVADQVPNLPGEQTVTSAVITAGFVIFSTNRPTPTNVVACTTSLGEARGYFMNLFTASGAIGVTGNEGGDRSSIFVGGGLPPSPVVAVVPIGGVLKPIVIGAVQKDGGSSSPIGSQEVRPIIKSYRTPVYWFKTGDSDTSDD